MTLRSKIFLACESLLRVPPLFVIDEIFRYNFGLSEKWLIGETEAGIWNNDSITPAPQNNDSQKGSSFLSTLARGLGSISLTSELTSTAHLTGDTSQGHLFQLDFHGFEPENSLVGDAFKVLRVLALLQLCAAALVCFVLSTKNLVKLYSYILAFASVYLSFSLRPIAIDDMTWRSFLLVLPNVSMRSLLAGTYFLTRMWPGGYPRNQSSLQQFPATILGLMDALMFSMFFVTGVIRMPSFFFLSVVILLQGSLWTGVPKLYRFLFASWEDTKRIRNDYGISHLIQRETGRLRINVVFRLFWISRALYDLVYNLPDHTLPEAFRLLMTNGTETLLGIIGLTLTISGIAHQIGAFLMWILYRGTNSEPDVNRFGSISTVLFFILCLQTSLTSLHPEKRLDRLIKNLVLLITALLHALHQMVAPLLHAFRSFQALQVRAVILSLVFLSVSFWSSIVILRTTNISTWSMAVIALALEFKIKIIVSLLISLFVYFAQRIDTPQLLVQGRQHLRVILPEPFLHFIAHVSDQLDNDDIIFYLKAFSQSAEFLTGIFLLGNAIWIFLFESASTIRALGMAIHAYFNIWCEGKKGLRVYVQRRTASKKIDSLGDASAEQLAGRKDDVCAICYEEMESAKVTLCGHLFHAVCLRKWLYIQNTCPLCHEILYSEEEVEQDGGGGEGVGGGGEVEENPAIGAVALGNENPAIEMVAPTIEASLLEPPQQLETDSESDFWEDSQAVPSNYPGARSTVGSQRSRASVPWDARERAYFQARGRDEQNSSTAASSSSDNQFRGFMSYRGRGSYRCQPNRLRAELRGQSSSANSYEVYPRRQVSRKEIRGLPQNTLENTSDSDSDLT